MVIPHADMAQVRKVILAYATSAGTPWQKYAPDGPGAREKPLNDRFMGKLTIPTDPPDAQTQADAVTAAVKSGALSAFGRLTDPNAKLPDQLINKILIPTAGKLPASMLPAADKAKFIAAISATTQPVTQIRPREIKALRDAAAKVIPAAERAKDLGLFDAAFARYTQEAPDPRILEIFVAYANDGGVSCVKCHDMAGDASAVPAEWAALSSQAGGAADDATVFRTKPTGIPAGPRRWYVNSEFNHDAHRSMNCLECHAAALTSEKTSDILSPDMQWQGFRVDENNQLVAAQRSCVECHHPDNAEGPGAASNCTECHVFHDRSHERMVKPADMGKVSVSEAK
jgi:hypothetical protein